MVWCIVLYCIVFFEKQMKCKLCQAGGGTECFSGPGVGPTAITSKLATELIKPEGNGKESRNLRPKVPYLERDQHFS